MDLGIKDKVALITGGNRGIGLASALEMAGEGCNIIITGRNEADLAKAEARIKALGVGTLAVAADLEQAAGVDKLISAAFDTFGRVDILFNNAGHINPSSTIDATDAQWESLINIHLMACVRICRAIIPTMRERGWGRIINMSSAAGIAPASGIPDYSAIKAAVISYTRSVAMEFSRDGICATAICPGLIHTELWDHLADDIGREAEKTRQEVFDAFSENSLGVKRYARPEEVGKVVAFLASEAASFMTGCAIQVDGGILAGIEHKL